MLERYEIEHELASGARGAVFRARDPRTGDEVAIKVGPAQGRHIRSAPAPCASSGVLALAHPHITALREYGDEGHLSYVVSDLAAGHGLFRHTRVPHLLPLPIVLGLVADIGGALEHMHGEGIAHGDVKPANMLFDAATGAVALVDLPVDESDAGATPAYLAPERLCGGKASAASDQFALGVTLYQLCSGELPFTGRSWPEIAYRIVHGPHTDIRACVPTLPTTLAAVIDKALAKHPEHRFLSAAAFARAVADVLRTQ